MCIRDRLWSMVLQVLHNASHAWRIMMAGCNLTQRVMMCGFQLRMAHQILRRRVQRGLGRTVLVGWRLVSSVGAELRALHSRREEALLESSVVQQQVALLVVAAVQTGNWHILRLLKAHSHAQTEKALASNGSSC
eukprot:876310-Rhodomonas_salina.1